MKEMNAVSWFAWVLVVVGGLNWGLVGLFEYNLVDELFGEGSSVARLVYSVVGFATLALVGMALMKSEKTTASK